MISRKGFRNQKRREDPAQKLVQCSLNNFRELPKINRPVTASFEAACDKSV